MTPHDIRPGVVLRVIFPYASALLSAPSPASKQSKTHAPATG